ncbi:serine/arginine-rich splicing factor 11 isoform X2 [Carettochelys insculpta]|uniref:serine/arginine-rich splicing factor 11 isoform X2 n=1 Tax=Carettochelys insculpta TaxID=44489 RepID=UPI003EB9AEA6
MASSSGTDVIQVTNVSPSASSEQMRTLFGFLGKIEELRLFPPDDSPLPVSSRVCFVKFHDPDSAVVAQHLTNTVFVDRALIVVPYAEGIIPDETKALSLLAPANAVAGLLPGGGLLPTPNPLSQIGAVPLAALGAPALDPALAALGLPGANLNSQSLAADQLLKLMSTVDPKLNHVAAGLVSPSLKSDTSSKEIEEAMKRVREAQSLISAAIEPDKKDEKRRHSRSRSRSRRRRTPSTSRHRSTQLDTFNSRCPSEPDMKDVPSPVEDFHSLAITRETRDDLILETIPFPKRSRSRSRRRSHSKSRSRRRSKSPRRRRSHSRERGRRSRSTSKTKDKKKEEKEKKRSKTPPKSYSTTRRSRSTSRERRRRRSRSGTRSPKKPRSPKRKLSRSPSPRRHKKEKKKDKDKERSRDERERSTSKKKKSKDKEKERERKSESDKDVKVTRDYDEEEQGYDSEKEKKEEKKVADAASPKVKESPVDKGSGDSARESKNADGRIAGNRIMKWKGVHHLYNS